MQRTRHKRPWLAALLALVYPGLGHAYLREWGRALLWFGLIFLTATLLVPESAVPETLSVEALTQMSRDVPWETTLAIGVVSGLSVVDAYWTATRNNSQGTDGETGTSCPNCGREVDEDLDFCHWCTAKLDVPENAAE